MMNLPAAWKNIYIRKIVARKPSSVTTTIWKTTALVVPDQHFPYNDKPYWKLLLEVANKGGFNTLIVMGDFVDFYRVSGYRKDPRHRMPFTQEVKTANLALDQLDKIPGIQRRIFIEGNHENRLERLIFDKVPELVDFVDFPSLLRLRERRYEIVPYHQSITVGKLILKHDITYTGRSAVHRNLDAVGDNIGVGHTHHLGIHYAATAFGKPLVSASFGHGLDLSDGHTRLIEARQPLRGGPAAQ